MSKYLKVSAFLEKCFCILAFLPLPLEMLLWAYVRFPNRTIFGFPLVNGPFGVTAFSNPSLPIMSDLSLSLRFGGFMASLPLVALKTYWLWQLKGLFSFYAKGEIFTASTTGKIRNTAMAFLTTVFLSIFVESILSVILTANNPAGSRMLSVAFGSNHFFDILTGLVLVVIAWIMDEGRKLKEDVEYTI